MIVSNADWPSGTRVLGAAADTPAPPAYTIATLVTEPAEYAAMRASFAAGGFTDDVCEFLVIDNTQTTSREQTDAYTGLNRALDEARAPFVILCHQDVRLTRDKRRRLEACLADLSALDASWALAGNAGGVSAGRLSVRISDPHGADQNVGPFPSRVTSLDENFIVVRRAARVGLSSDLTGYHFYGADLCLAADVLGYTAYVIDFHLQHLSPGRKSADFYASEKAFRNKWSHAFRPRWLQTTCSLLLLSGDGGSKIYGRALEVAARVLSRRLPGARGWRGAGSQSPSAT